MKFWPRFATRKQTDKTSGLGKSLQILIICNDTDSDGMSVVENLLPVLEFAKLRYSILDLGRITAWPHLPSFASIIIATNLLEPLSKSQLAKIREYLLAGGGILVACRSWNSELADLFGFADRNQPEMANKDGLDFGSDFYPGATGLEVQLEDWPFTHHSYVVGTPDLLPDCTILATSDDGSPILWRRRASRGKAVYWNTDELYSRSLRGFLLQTLLMTMPIGIAAIGGFGVFQIDDYPPALSDDRREPVNTEYGGLDCNSFFFDVWITDMIQLRDRHHLKYTWYVIMDYDDIDNTQMPNPDSDGYRERERIRNLRFKYLSSRTSGDEFGFHGYNHVPLTSDTWPDASILEAKLKHSRQIWQDSVSSPLPLSWVPTNNWYQRKELEALSRSFPEIAVICSTHSVGEFSMGEYRDFGPEPWDGSLLCLPRQTCGYVLNSEYRMLMVSQLAALGIWTHFVHPDDVYDLPQVSGRAEKHRNYLALNWKSPNALGKAGMFEMLNNWLCFVRERFPWLEFVTTSEAASRYRSHMANRVEITNLTDGLFIQCDRECLLSVRVDRHTHLIFDDSMRLLGRNSMQEDSILYLRAPAGSSRITLRAKGSSQ